MCAAHRWWPKTCSARLFPDTALHLDTFGEFEVLRFSLDLSWSERNTIRVAEMERDHDIRIVAFERGDGSASSIPTRESILYNGDSVLACVRHELIGQFSKYIQD